MINADLSAKYRICTYGPRGVEILDGNRQVIKFVTRPTSSENWQAALDWAREQERKQQEAQHANVG